MTSVDTFVAELQTLDQEALDVRYQELRNQYKAAHIACMQNGGVVQDEFHSHSQDAAIRGACIGSLDTCNLIFWEYERRGVKNPRQRARDAEIDQLFA